MLHSLVKHSCSLELPGHVDETRLFHQTKAFPGVLHWKDVVEKEGKVMTPSEMLRVGLVNPVTPPPIPLSKPCDR